MKEKITVGILSFGMIFVCGFFLMAYNLHEITHELINQHGIGWAIFPGIGFIISFFMGGMLIKWLIEDTIYTVSLKRQNHKQGETP